MLGFPIPQIVLAEKRDSPGHYLVLDGKQRLLALRQFFSDEGEPRDSEFSPLKLTGLEVLPEINRLDMKSLGEYRDDLLAAIENHSIRTVVLSNWNSERLLLSLFLRLNTGSVALSAQELRQALIPGEFMKWLDQASGDSVELKQLLNNTHPDRRMVDAELLLRHLAFSTSPLPYAGNLKQFLDDTSKYFNDHWATKFPVAKECLDGFNSALRVGLDAIGSDEFGRKWARGHGGKIGRFERALNRAVFDVQVYSLSFANIREVFARQHSEVMGKYKHLCESDEEFLRSISLTTKTADAFLTRHRVWHSIVVEVTGEDYPLPSPLLPKK